MKIPPVKVVFSPEDRQEIMVRVEEILSTGMLAQGKYVKEFEDRWATYVGAKHAIAVSSGSSAIEVTMRSIGIEGKEVLVPDNTFAATAVSVLMAGGRVRFVDTEPTTFSVRLDELKARYTPNTVGVIIVHLGGIITPEIEAIRQWCDSQGIWLFEDCAHAHGSEWNERRAGTFGLAGGYSFFATKVMTTAEGGMIVTNDDTLAERARLVRNHGKPEPWVSYHTHLGTNWRMSELNAILGLTQLKRLDEFIAWRKKIADIYTKRLEDIPQLTSVLPLARSSWYKYIVWLPQGIDRSRLKQEMRERGVKLSGEIYATPLHRQPIFQNMTQDDFPKTDEICSRHICLPLYVGMTEEEARFVVETLKTVLASLISNS